MSAGNQSGKERPLARVIGWRGAALKKYDAAFHRAGFVTDISPFKPSGIVGQFARQGPAAVVLDCDNRPSDARAIAVMLRMSRAARHIPLVFAGGVQEKLARLRRDLPDATFCRWEEAAAAVKRIVRAPLPVRVVVPAERFSGAPLPKKLGLGTDMRVALLHAPEGFEEILGDLPEGVRLGARIHKETRLALCFAYNAEAVDHIAAQMQKSLPPAASVWVMHPKMTGRYHTDFNQNHVRAVMRAAGFMDYKVCAVDQDWSGLKFSRKAG
jgi:hypothetical protein